MATTYEPSYFSMPGSFHSDGVHPGLIRPPTSPDVSTPNSGILPPAVGPISTSVPSAIPRTAQKRRRGGSTFGSSNEKSGAAFTGRFDPPTPYVLGGSLATPGGYANAGYGAEAKALDESVFSESDYRTVLGSKRRHDDLDASATAAPTSLFAHPAEPTTPSIGWGQFAFSTIGGVVGKMWNFCVGSKFQGFHAGQGQGYSVSAPQDEMEDSMIEDTAARPSMPGGWQSLADQRSGPVPLLDEPDGLSSRASTPPRPAAKRRQTDKTDGLGRNWVVIPQPDQDSPGANAPSSNSARKASPCRNRNSGPAMTTGRRISTPNARRTSGQYATSPALTSRRTSRVHVRGTNPLPHPGRPASRASFASPRCPTSYREEFESDGSEDELEDAYEEEYMLRGSIGERTARYHTSQPSPPSGFSSTLNSSSHRRSQSSASAASARRTAIDHRQPFQQSPARRRESMAGEARGSSRGSGNSQGQSPRLDSEAIRLASKRQKEEKQADVRMAAFNKRLQDMIRQGKEALGTTVDVEMENGEGAWEDDD